MSITLKKFLEVYQPKAGDEKKFKDKHITVKQKDPNGNGDDVFQATNIKAVDRQKEAHGYNPGKDELVYEEVEELSEMDFRTAKELASKFKNKGDNRKSALYLKLADALKRGDNTTAQGFMSQIKGMSEETEIDEMSDVQKKRREDIVKGMKKNMASFKQRYGKEAKSVMYATATKRAMGEEVEEIEELDKSTMRSYVNKAAVDVARSGNTLGRMQVNKSKAGADIMNKHIGKRLKGIDTATKKMAKEDVDVTLLQLYMGLDEENQEVLVQMIDEGRKEELLEFAQTALELVDGNNN